MTLHQKIIEDWKQSVKDKDAPLKKALTYIRSKLQEKAKAAKVNALPDEDAVSVLRKLGKEQKDFVDNYGGEDAIFELSVIESYLPKLMGEDAARERVAQHIASLDFEPTVKDMGKVIGPLMKELKGQVDGGVIQRLVKEALS